MTELTQEREAQELGLADTLFAGGRKADAMEVWKRLSDDGSGEACLILSHKYTFGGHQGIIGGFISDLTGRGSSKPVDAEKSDFYFQRAVDLEYSPALFSKAASAFRAGKFEESFEFAGRAVDAPIYTPRTVQAITLLARLYADGKGCEPHLPHAYMLKCVSEVLFEKLTRQQQGSIALQNLSDLNDQAALDRYRQQVVPAFFDEIEKNGGRPRLALPIETPLSALMEQKPSEYSSTSLGDLVGAELVAMFKDWVLTRIYPPNGTNVPVSTPEGVYANQREYLEAQSGMLHCIEQVYEGMPFRVTFYQYSALCEVNPDQENCEALLLEPMPDPAMAQDNGAQDSRGGWEGELSSLSKESQMASFLSALLKGSEELEGLGYTVNDMAVMDIYNIFVWCTKMNLRQ